MDLSDARAWAGLTAGVTGTRTGSAVSGSAGVAATPASFADADALRSCEADLKFAAATADAVTYVVSFGDLNSTAGTPVVRDSSVDFEGLDTAEIASLYAILIERTDTNDGRVTAESNNGLWKASLAGGERHVIICAGGNPSGLAADTILCTYETGEDTAATRTIRITALGKTAAP